MRAHFHEKRLIQPNAVIARWPAQLSQAYATVGPVTGALNLLGWMKME